MEILTSLTSLFDSGLLGEIDLITVLHICFVVGILGFSLWILYLKQQLKKHTAVLEHLNENLQEQVALKTQQYQKISDELLIKNAELDKIVSELSTQNERCKDISSQLEINEEKYRSFVSQSGDGIGIINAEGKIVEWNRKMEAITGFFRKNVLNGPMWEVEFNLLPLADRTPERKITLQQKYLMDLSQMEMKEPFAFEEEIFNARGETRKIMSIIFPIITSKQNYVGTITRDITDEIKQNENEFGSKLLQVVQNLVLVLDVEGRIIRFNDAYEQLTGYNKDEIFYRYFWDINYPEDKRKKIADQFRLNVKANFIPCEINGMIYTKAGDKKKILWKFNSLNDEAGRFQYLIYSGTDLTDFLLKEEALELSELRFRRMFENNLTGVILYEPILDENGEISDIRYVKINSAFQEQTGTPPEKLLGKTFREVFPNNDPVFIEEYKTYKETGRYINYEQYFAPAGKYFRIQHFELVPGLMALTFDNVTEQKKMEQKLIETVINIEERGHKRIARDLHDEVGPQLASMNVYISSLSRKIENPEHLEILKLLKELLKESIAHIREISNNLTPNIIERYGLIAAINTEIESMRLIVPVSFTHFNVEERFDHKIELAVYRIVKELLNNTKKYAQATEVDLQMELIPAGLKVQFKDNGVGFDYEKKIQDGNVGMGLLNIESRLKALHGTFVMKSKPTQGVLFTMNIPLYNKHNK